MTKISDGVPIVVPGDCIDYTDILAYPSCCDYDLCCSQAVIESKLLLAIAIIEQITGSKICPYTECKLFKSTETKIIYFNPITSHKLIEVTSVKNPGCTTSLDVC